jgi:hypothetical protein
MLVAPSTFINISGAERQKDKTLLEVVGKHMKKIDMALPRQHTRILYNSLGRKKAGVLARLRTGMARLNRYLHHIDVADSDQCACGQASGNTETW